MLSTGCGMSLPFSRPWTSRRTALGSCLCLETSHGCPSPIACRPATLQTTPGGANGQKNMFRQDPTHPSVSHLKTMPTERGTKLIISGWWGIVRHINYTGDWLMGLAWCLPCGYQHIIPYFYAIYFGVLLIHREMRDEHACREKYGKDWGKYCSIVKYRLVPFVY
mmetsp:Transcript_35530/g.100576  ORF Transcript_35530/g.100576 Transcript_35530/m.100576 type:complete len:165 (+) Transcript_35530:876-1370(+)